MRRDLIKTALGVVLIGLVIVATFLYGNHQTQEKKQKDQTAQEERRKQATTQNAKKPANSQPAKPAAQTPASQKPVAQSQPSTTPQTGANTPLPKTGGVIVVLPAVAMIAAGRFYWHSRRWVETDISDSR